MKVMFFILLMSISHFGKGQVLSSQLFEDIFNYSFAELDHIMTGKHYFIRIRDVEDKDQLVYTNGNFENDKIIVLTILLRPHDQKNVATAVAGKSVDLESFKNELIHNGFTHSGERKLSNDIPVFLYIKNKNSIIITKNPTEIGVYQIVSVP